MSGPGPWIALELAAPLDYVGSLGVGRQQLPAILGRGPGQVEDALALLLEHGLARTWRCPDCGTARVVAARMRTVTRTPKEGR
jgi:hypothetical protein